MVSTIFSVSNHCNYWWSRCRTSYQVYRNLNEKDEPVFSLIFSLSKY